LGMPVEQINERIEHVVREVELENLVDRDIFKLSGGEKQRIACGSVAAMLPDIIVLDEPTSNLDIESIEILKHILMLWKKHNKTIIIAEHRLYWLKDVCDRAVICRMAKYR
uniref:ATP-binding cassette domain-containing protein n=1 Tax=Coprococcus sp. TaxID=2049024 RepID=UPI0040288280